MSLIHEALEKLDQEKKPEEKEPILELVERQASSPKSIRSNDKTLYAIGGTLVFLFILGILYLLLNHPRIDESQKDTGKVLSLSSPSERSMAHVLPISIHRNRFSLTGISRVGNDWTAIINNQLVRVGDRVSGASIKEIREEGVLLEYNEQLIALGMYGDASTHFTSLEKA
ncbi:MAG: hypothetical protein HY447_04710 [Candidatus Omnitrophica bacterium]|nr:hypothetical protein [Candidatus Omnitrophota bacterium]